MDTEKILLLILGAIVGFFASIAKDYFSEKTKRKYKEIEIRREKAEELYILLEKWANYFFNQKNQLVLVMKEQISYNDYLDYIIEEGEKNTIEYKRIEMIISIYFKDFSKNHKKIVNQMSTVHDIELVYKTAYVDGENGEKYIKPLLSETLKATNYIDDLKNEVALYVNNLR